MNIQVEQAEKNRICQANTAFLDRCKSLKPGDQAIFGEMLLKGVVFRKPDGETLYTIGVEDCYAGVRNATKVVPQGSEGFVKLVSDTEFLRYEEPVVVVAICTAL
jgi:hypothetical protein